MADIQSIALRKFLEVLGKLFGVWDSRPVEEDRDYRNVSLQRRGNFDANEIFWIIQAAASLFVFSSYPVWPNDREQHVALGNFLTQDLGEIYSKWDIVDIHEQQVRPELIYQPIMN